MGKDFNLGRVGKRMPYTTPPDFFDTLEQGIRDKTLGDDARRPRRRLPRRRAGIWIAAAMAATAAAVALIVPTDGGLPTAPSSAELAFSNLPAEDQEYFMGLLDDDVFFADDAETYIDEQ